MVRLVGAMAGSMAGALVDTLLAIAARVGSISRGGSASRQACRLFEFQIGFGDDFAPLRHLGADHRAELFGRGGDDFRAAALHFFA